MLERHNSAITLGAGIYTQRRRQALFCHEERMVARSRKARRKTHKEAGAIVCNAGDVAMLRLACNYASSKCNCEALVS